MPTASPTLVDQIKNNFKTCIFLSPHLDDAVFSAGDLLLSLQMNDVHCVVVTFFTQIHNGKPTLSARQFLKQSTAPSAQVLFSNRRDEDKQIFVRHHIDSLHLPYFDAMWRLHPHPSMLASVLGKILPEFIHLYPTYRWHIKQGLIHPSDNTPTILAQEIAELSADYANTLFLAPVGTGSHTDHLLVRNAVSKLDLPLLYWNDYPYSLHSTPDTAFLHSHHLKPLRFSYSWEEKRKLILEYKTQVSAIFPTGVPQTGEEIYYLSPAMRAMLS